MAGTIVADTLQDGAGNSTTMDNAIYGSAKAWASFYYSSSIIINSSYNVSSITRSSTGVYVIAFTNALTDAKYLISSGTSSSTSNTPTPTGNTFVGQGFQPSSKTTSGFTMVNLATGSATAYDLTEQGFAIFR